MAPYDSGGIRWSDVGNWSSFEEVTPRDKAGNVVSGRVIDLGQPEFRSLCRPPRGGHHRPRGYGGGGYTGCDIGLSQDTSQDVKKMVEILKQQGAPEHLEHLTVFGHGDPIRCWRRGRAIRSSG